VAEKTMQEYNELSDRFILLANEMTTEGKEMQMVNAALMSASGVYATYTAAGNGGGLTDSGVDQVTATYKANLESIQRFKLSKNSEK
jgi:hypothetical protein